MNSKEVVCTKYTCINIMPDTCPKVKLGIPTHIDNTHSRHIIYSKGTQMTLLLSFLMCLYIFLSLILIFSLNGEVIV